MEKGEGGKDFNAISNGDVVILPAFGGTIQELQLLDQKYVYDFFNIRIDISSDQSTKFIIEVCKLWILLVLG